MNVIMGFIRDSQVGFLIIDYFIICLDLYNIKYQYNINCMEKDQDDVNSVMYWVVEMEREEYNFVLCFKS